MAFEQGQLENLPLAYAASTEDLAGRGFSVPPSTGSTALRENNELQPALTDVSYTVHTPPGGPFPLEGFRRRQAVCPSQQGGFRKVT